MESLRNITPLVLAFTPNYLIPAATLLCSVLAHAAAGERFQVICLLSEPLPLQMQQDLQAIDRQRLTFRYINLEGALQDIYINPKYTVAASYRLLLPDLLPEYDKVLYLDCDMVVRNDLGRLFRETAMDSHYLAGVVEASLDFQVPHLEAIGCPQGSYINSGFLIMNLDKLRKDGLVPTFIEASKADNLEFPDQDVLNMVCKSAILALPPHYNSIRTFFLPQYKADFLRYYTEAEWQMVQQHGNIHYTGAKPWRAFTVMFNVWWNHFEKLPIQLRKQAFAAGRMQLLHKLYRTAAGRSLINGMQQLYRRYQLNKAL